MRREREQFGRECPGQWSWIGGLTGPTNPTWHLEMRDFLVKPQYEYAMDDLTFYGIMASTGNATLSTKVTDSDVGSVASTVEVPRVLILFGSETGTAESVAMQLKRTIRLLNPVLMKLDDAAGLDIVRKRRFDYVLCICSTFGEGGPPSNAGKFLGTPIGRDVPLSTKYAVLALGSTLYPDFCKAGVELDRMFGSAGLQSAVSLVKADEIGGGETARKDWIDIVKRVVLPPQLEEQLAGSRDDTLTVYNTINWSVQIEPKRSEGMRKSRCIENERLTETIRKVTFEVPEGESYSTGDHLVVYPLNSKKKIREFLLYFVAELRKSALNLDAIANESSASDDEVVDSLLHCPFCIETFMGDLSEPADVFFDMPSTLETLMTKQCDMAMNEGVLLNLVKLMKERLDELLESLREDQQGMDLVMAHGTVIEFLRIERHLYGTKNSIDGVIAQYPNILVFFKRFQDIFLDRFVEKQLGREGADPLVSLADVLVCAQRLQPRYYSISSSSNVSPSQVTITVGILKTKTSKGVPVEGVCSHYLASLTPGVDEAVIGIRKSSFRLPKDTQAPLIMVGAGTGLSPMMGFLQDRALDRENGAVVGPIHLFFGCRDESFFIYQNEIREYEKSGLITLHLAMSRSKSMPKTYVQHKLEAMGKEGSDLLLTPHTHYYVCGDARMANECHEACVQLLRVHGDMSRVAAVQNLTKMRVDGRWQTDVWGIVCKCMACTARWSLLRVLCCYCCSHTFFLECLVACLLSLTCLSTSQLILRIQKRLPRPTGKQQPRFGSKGSMINRKRVCLEKGDLETYCFDEQTANPFISDVVVVVVGQVSLMYFTNML